MSPWWLVVTFSVAFIGLAKSGFGSGLGLLAVPLVTLAMEHIPGRGATAALGFLLPLLVAGDLIAVWQYRRLLGFGVVRRLLWGSAVGLVLGGFLLWWFHHRKSDALAEALVSTEIGVESIFLVSLHWYNRWRGGVGKPLMDEPLRGNVTGVVAAISSTLAHGAGPIVAAYLLPLKLDRQLFVGTSATYFFILNTAKLPSYGLTGQFAKVSPAFAALFLPALAAGAVAGLWLNRRMSDRLFKETVYLSTFLLGCYILQQGVRAFATLHFH